MPTRDLSLVELEEAQFLSRRIAKIEGASQFTTECEELARNGMLTRGQLDYLRKKVKAAKPIDYTKQHQSLRGRHSKRPITLPKLSGTDDKQ